MVSHTLFGNAQDTQTDNPLQILMELF